MAFVLSAQAIADGCIFCLAVDEDGTTIKEFANPTVNAAKVVDAGVTIGTKAWKGDTHHYFETFDNGGFDFLGIEWTTANGCLFAIAAPQGIALGVVSAGISAGNNSRYFVSFQQDQLGLRINGSNKAEINFGSPGAATTTTIPVDGTSFHVGFDYDGFTGGTSDAGYGTEAGSFAFEDDAAQGEFGGNNRLTDIGGTQGNGSQPGKWHIIYGFENKIGEALFQTIHADPWDYFFAEAPPPDPVSVTDAVFKLSGGAANYSCDSALGGAIAPREVMSGLINFPFPPITTAQALSGRTDYLCIYISNPEAGPIEAVELYITSSPSGSTMAIGLDPAGVGGTATTIANTTTAPVGVSFSAPTSGAPLSIGDIPAGSSQAIWVRRVTPAASGFSNNQSLALRARDINDDTKSVVLRHAVLAADTRVWEQVAAVNQMNDVDPCPANNCMYSGSGGQASIAFAWGSAATRLVGELLESYRCGGGHGDYGGNEMYSFTWFDVSGDPVFQWFRLTNPSTPSGGSEASGKYGDGLPRSVHSGHSAIVFDSFNDAVFIPVMASEYINAGGSTQCFNYEVVTDTWDTTLPADGPQNPGGGSVGGSDNNRSCFLTGLNQIFFEPNNSRGNWALWDCATKTWSDYIGGNDTDSETEITIYDYRRHLVYGFGNQVDDEISVWTVGPGGVPTKTTTTGTPASTITASSTLGALYDQLTDTVVAWDGGEDLIDMNPSTRVWTTRTIDPGDTPPAAEANGTFKQFDYAPPTNARPRGSYLLFTSTSTDPFIFNAGAEPDPPEEQGGMQGQMTGPEPNIEGQNMQVV